MKLISIDAETNRLRGQAFAIGAVATDDNGSDLEYLLLRCPIIPPGGNLSVIDPWVRDNVLPPLRDIECTHDTYPDMLAAFREFLDRHDGLLVAHVAWPVEARLLLDTYPDVGGPYPLIDVAGALLAQGHDPRSVDGYLNDRGAPVTGYGSPHNPLYDSVAAERCLRLLMEEGTTP